MVIFGIPCPIRRGGLIAQARSHRGVTFGEQRALRRLTVVRRIAVALCVGVIALAATRADAAPVLVGQFFLTNDPTVNLFDPTFWVENDSSATTPETFTNVQLWMDVSDGLGGITTDEFSLATSLAPGDPAVNSNGLVDPVSFSSLLPDLSTVQSAWITLSTSDPGVISLGQPGCVGCTMTNFGDGSTLAIYFDPASTTSVPEPGTMALFGSGLLVAVLMKRRTIVRQ